MLVREPDKNGVGPHFGSEPDKKLPGRPATPEGGPVSFLHCPACSRAYNVASHPACPSCGVRAGTPADPVEDVIAAAAQLARAVARATPEQLAIAANAVAPERMLPAPGSRDDGVNILRAVRAALAPPPPPPTNQANTALLATVALALVTRIAPRPSTIERFATRAGAWSARARAVLARMRA
jgi:hypothetical protein